MTEEQIQGNKLIAGFMGSEYINDPYKYHKDDKELTDFWHWSKPTDGYPVCRITGIEWSTAIQIGNFKYHSSWDWLMPVVEKIEGLDNELCNEYFWNKEDSRQHNDFRIFRVQNILDLFKEVVDFLSWYNENK